MKILVFPKDTNPYQELLYSQLRVLNTDVKYLENPTKSQSLGFLFLFFQVLYYRLKGYSIFHIHWIYSFYSPFRKGILSNKYITFIYSQILILFLLYVKLLRYRVIWTVHNVLPQESHFNDDLQIIKILSKLCYSKIVHSISTLNEMKKLGINTDNSYIIPIGNYGNIYPNTIDKQNARKKLGINDNLFVLCFFGKIEKYKGVFELVKKFLLIKKRNIILVIAGECQNKELKNKLLKYKNINIILNLNYIQNELVQVYLNASDIAVFPFKAITTSSSVILALSFSKPIICPKIGNLIDLPENLGFFYDLSNKDGLLQCINKAILKKNELGIMSENAKKYAESFSWKNIAYQTYEVYKKTLITKYE